MHRHLPSARVLGAGIVVATFIAVVWSLLRNGAVLTTPMLGRTWQLQDTTLLARDPVGTTWYLHVQPPLYNLAVGSVLAWSPFPPIGTLYVLYLAALLAIGLLIWDLLTRWRVPSVVSGLIASLVISEPDLLRTVVWHSYEIPVALMLVAACWSLQRLLQGGGGRWLITASCALTAATLTRSLVHPVVVLAVVLLGAWLASASRRATIVAVLVPVVLVGGWTVRSQVLFDTTSSSSWFGFNLQRGVTAPMDRADVEAAVAEGAVGPNALVQPWQDLGAYEAGPCRPDRRHRSLSEVTRLDTGGVNLNNACFIPVYAEAEDDAWQLVRRSPGRYVEARAEILPTSFSVARVGLSDDVASFSGHVRPERTWMDAFADRWQLTTHHRVDMADWNLPLIGLTSLPYDLSWSLVVCAVAVLVRSIVALVRIVGDRRAVADPAGEAMWLVVAALVVLVVGGGTLFEFGENGRFRAIIDPLVLGVALGGAWRWGAARR
ncbi:MAG: hypothetical protein KF906_12255 [Actinobacteria bacterium]|nr:hypothetical protein [Actinomycetota bacterium]